MVRYPLRFKPLLKTRVWGGDYLPSLYNIPLAEPIGESWEICDHNENISCIANGKHKNKSLHTLFTEERKELIGNAFNTNCPDRFPLMFKLIDAKTNLSVQVHPNDQQAEETISGELGKTEAWYILSCDENAVIYRGLKAGTNMAKLTQALNNGTVEQVLNKITVKPGEIYHLPAGTIHALGGGVRIAEIQQNSDTTYRLFDWNRTGIDGKPRPLHLENGLKVVNLKAYSAALSKKAK